MLNNRHLAQTAMAAKTIPPNTGGRPRSITLNEVAHNYFTKEKTRLNPNKKQVQTAIPSKFHSKRNSNACEEARLLTQLATSIMGSQKNSIPGNSDLDDFLQNQTF